MALRQFGVTAAHHEAVVRPDLSAAGGRPGTDLHLEAPNPALLITGPEPTLDEVKWERLSVAKADDELVAQMLVEVRGAFREESAEVVEIDAVELVDERTRIPAELRESSPRRNVALKRRFDKNELCDARSVVVLRDVRRDRPHKTSPHAQTNAKRKPTGSDPPE